MTAESAKSCLMGAPVGTYVAAETNNELFHTMIVADSDKTALLYTRRITAEDAA